ncbi:hypothetical protein D8S78_14865 [Natrialba swarupiae]|nr:hypothetical protein [Natrialba swarupiae]
MSDETGWLLLKKNHGGSDDDEDGELKAWVCWGVDDASLEQLVSWSQVRWTIEQFTGTSSRISEQTSIRVAPGRAFITTSRW